MGSMGGGTGPWSLLGGSTRGGAAGGASSAGLTAGSTAPMAVAAGVGARALLAGSGSGSVGGGVDVGADTATVAGGGASLLGRLEVTGAVVAHDHLSAPEGGVIDYARLLISSTAPPAPASPSDAFWLNPNEVA